jgi:putative DNA primase/helicase
MNIQSINPTSVSAFDKDRQLLNCQNGTLDLHSLSLRPRRSDYLITKIAQVKFGQRARYPRREHFILEGMLGNESMAEYHQKAMH